MENYYEDYRPSRQLAWHETLELHELVVFQSIGLMKCKKSLSKIKDNNLRSIYMHAIRSLESNIRELLQFYPAAPAARDDFVDETRNTDAVFYAGDLLVFSKAGVRNYAVAITETATPQLRNTLSKQIDGMIKLHGMVYYYMYERGYYPSYDLQKLLNNDVKLAHKALMLGQ